MEISQYIMFADAMPDHNQDTASRPASPPSNLIPSFSMEDMQSDMEFPRLSDEEEDMLVQVG